jgi:hypothetical protein
MINPSGTRKILLLSANPSGTSQLRLDEEMREIKEGLRRSSYRERYSVERAEAARYRDIHRAILEYSPHIVHFSGHGSGKDGLLLEDETGQIKLVDAEAIAGLFQLFADTVECVVLNACYSKYQAEAIAQHIDYVVGMSQAIGDKAAIEFAVGFYDALLADKGYEFAYKLGCSLIQVAGISQQLIPTLIHGVTALPAMNPVDNLYIERPPIEEKCLEAIVQPGALIRIKAPQKMGKTSLLELVLDYARQQGYQTAKLDLKLADDSTIAYLETFLRWLCADVSESLLLEPKLDEYWQEIYGLNKNCTRYFQKYLLSDIKTPLVLAIDNFERLFEHSDVFPQFCLLLRSWYENALARR